TGGLSGQHVHRLGWTVETLFRRNADRRLAHFLVRERQRPTERIGVLVLPTVNDEVDRISSLDLDVGGMSLDRAVLSDPFADLALAAGDEAAADAVAVGRTVGQIAGDGQYTVSR